ncbi:hypothetical protein [Dysgonomonas massiliensis]|uniref:hypothetical protein n=1 Tax=Dysgonomonas massiliensis TaxID=2040292 RepID=UPI000C7873C1|nr:hypothetical protein [Dysgonomonas massiliensis]
MENKNKNKKSLRFVWSFVMIFVYLSVAYMLTQTKIFENISETIRYAMAVVFAVYGIFRGYRLYKHGK